MKLAAGRHPREQRGAARAPHAAPVPARRPFHVKQRRIAARCDSELLLSLGHEPRPRSGPVAAVVPSPSVAGSPPLLPTCDASRSWSARRPGARSTGPGESRHGRCATPGYETCACRGSQSIRPAARCLGPLIRRRAVVLLNGTAAHANLSSRGGEGGDALRVASPPRLRGGAARYPEGGGRMVAGSSTRGTAACDESKVRGLQRLERLL